MAQRPNVPDQQTPPDITPPDLRAEAVPAGPRRFLCRQCGAELVFRPGTGHLSCGYCGFVNEIDAEAASGIEELDFRAHMELLAEAEPQVEVSTVRCGACGSETEPPENLDAFDCAFCGANMVAGAIAARILRPRSLLPFAVTREQAHRIFRTWIAERWFAPNHLKRFSHSDGRIRGMYLPYWTYDANAVSDYTGMRGEHYYVTQTYTTTVNGRRQTGTRQVRKTRWYPAAGTVRNTFDDVLVAASGSLPVDDVEHLEPWDLDQLVPYQDDYLAGFAAEKYQVHLAAGFEIAGARMEPVIRDSIRRDIGGDEQQIASVDTRYHDVTFKHLLLPVWISAYRFRDQLYRILINARTGELRGRRPYSAWKIAFAVAGGILAVLAIMLAVRAFR